MTIYDFSEYSKVDLEIAIKMYTILEKIGLNFAEEKAVAEMYKELQNREGKNENTK